MEKQKRDGYTLIEVVVTVAILGLLLAIIASAVQSSQQAAISLQFANQVRNIAFATGIFEEQHGEGAHAGRLVRELAPFLGAKYEGMQSSVHTPALWKCPLSPDIDHRLGLISYLPNESVGYDFSLVDVPDGIVEYGFENHLLQQHTRWLCSHDSIIDGASQTLLLSERVTQHMSRYPERYSDEDMTPVNVVSSTPPPRQLETLWDTGQNAASVDELSTHCQQTEPVDWLPRWDPNQPSGTSVSRGFDTINTPNSIGCMNGTAADGPSTITSNPASSDHSGGVNVALADRSVRFISESIDLSTWRAMGTAIANDLLDW